jgi:hypothetical protein
MAAPIPGSRAWTRRHCVSTLANVRARRSTFLSRTAVSSAVLLMSAWSFAQTSTPVTAQQVFDRANKAYGQKDFRVAASGFEDAYRLAPNYKVLLAAGMAWHYANQPVRAANLLEKFLNDAPAGADNRKQAVNTLGELDATLGRIEVHGVDLATVGVDDEPKLSLNVVRVTPGEHLVHGACGTRSVSRSVRVVAGASESVLFDCGTAPTPSGTVPRVLSAPADTTASDKTKLSPVFFFAAAGGSLALGGLTVWSGVDTLALEDRFHQDRSNTALYDDGVSAQLRTNLLLGSAIVLAGVALYLGFRTDWGKSTPSAVAQK